MRLKSNIVMIIILCSLLVSVLLGICINNGDFSKHEEHIIIDEIMPTDFKNEIKNDINVPSQIVDVICDYMNLYYKSLYTLELNETSDLFSDEINGAISDAAIKLIVESRKQYNFDFGLNGGAYSLTFTDYKKDGEVYTVSLLEDDDFNFNFLDGITSKVRNIENTFVIENKDGKYLIKSLDKQQGYYTMFADNEPETVEMVDEIYTFYYDNLIRTIQNEEDLKDEAILHSYKSDKTIKLAYDRDKAVSYLDKYCLDRNPSWYDFSDEGGNCQNFASQVLFEGGIPMDYKGEEQWKCYISDPMYDPGINEDNKNLGRSRSWVNVNYFYSYVEDNKDVGLVADCDCNIEYAEPGDIIQVGLTSYSHTTVVSKVINNHILLDSNSIDMKDFPLEAYTYPKRRLIKILGTNS